MPLNYQPSSVNSATGRSWLRLGLLIGGCSATALVAWFFAMVVYERAPDLIVSSGWVEWLYLPSVFVSGCFVFRQYPTAYRIMWSLMGMFGATLGSLALIRWVGWPIFIAMGYDY